MPRVLHRIHSLGDDKWEIGWRQRPIAGALLLRPPLADHTPSEAEFVHRHASGACLAVEIGVFEGAGAASIRAAMEADGRLVLIDPYAPGKLGVSFQLVTAKRVVGRSSSRPTVEWIRATSREAANGWDAPIDLLKLDGRHDPDGLEEDWRDWAPHVRAGGTAIFRNTAGYPVSHAMETGGQWRKVDEVETLVALQRVA